MHAHYYLFIIVIGTTAHLDHIHLCKLPNQKKTISVSYIIMQKDIQLECTPSQQIVRCEEDAKNRQ